jgi:hypothetical protein
LVEPCSQWTEAAADHPERRKEERLVVEEMRYGLFVNNNQGSLLKITAIQIRGFTSNVPPSILHKTPLFGLRLITTIQTRGLNEKKWSGTFRNFPYFGSWLILAIEISVYFANFPG